MHIKFQKHGRNLTVSAFLLPLRLIYAILAISSLKLKTKRANDENTAKTCASHYCAGELRWLWQANIPLQMDLCPRKLRDNSLRRLQGNEARRQEFLPRPLQDNTCELKRSQKIRSSRKPSFSAFFYT
jgi:hypothetical protein